MKDPTASLLEGVSVLKGNTSKTKCTFFSTAAHSDWFISANRPINSSKLDILMLSLFPCLMPTPTEYRFHRSLKSPTYSFISSSTDIILVYASTNYSSDYWNRLASLHTSTSFSIKFSPYDVIKTI